MSREIFRLPERERELLRRHCDFYCSLASGKRRPETEAQRHFVAVCQGQAEPRTEHELAYSDLKKLMALSKMTTRQIANYEFAIEVPVGDERPQATQLEPRAKTSASPANDLSWREIDEFGDGVPRPGWCSDEGWKRMRSGYRSDSRD